MIVHDYKGGEAMNILMSRHSVWLTNELTWFSACMEDTHDYRG